MDIHISIIHIIIHIHWAHVIQADLELAILLPPPSKVLDLEEGINTSGTISILEMEKQRSKENSQFA